MVRLAHDVSEHADYVKARMVSNYYRIPEYARASIDVEDCTQDGLLYLHTVMNQKNGRTVKFDATKSKQSTFIYKVIDSYFSHLLKGLATKKRATVLVSLEDLNAVIGAAEKTSNIVKAYEARDRVMQLHRHASPALIDFIADNIYHPSTKLRVNITAEDFVYRRHPYTKQMRKQKLTSSEVFLKRQKELLTLACRFNVTADDYRLALMLEPRQA